MTHSPYRWREGRRASRPRRRRAPRGRRRERRPGPTRAVVAFVTATWFRFNVAAVTLLLLALGGACARTPDELALVPLVALAGGVPAYVSWKLALLLLAWQPPLSYVLGLLRYLWWAAFQPLVRERVHHALPLWFR